MGKMSESDFEFDRVRKFGFENSESEPIERNCRFDHLSAKHFRFKDFAPEPIQKSVFASGVKSIFKLYLSKSIFNDGKTTRSKVESID